MILILSFIHKFTNFVFYSNLWIAIAATCSVWQTLLFIDQRPISISLPLLIFTFSATLFIYAIHRIEGLKKVEAFKTEGRYLVISRFKFHILIYAILGALSTMISFFFLSWTSRLSLFIPATLSLGYVLPALSQNRRFRDIHFVKIFLIVLVWAWVGVILPMIECKIVLDQKIGWMILERMFFIFAITLPFDIRDLDIDQHTNVKTIPSTLGINKSKLLAILSLGLMLACCWMNMLNGWYALNQFSFFGIHAIISGIIIHFVDKKCHDYYFTGLLDGTIVLQFVFCYLTTM